MSSSSLWKCPKCGHRFVTKNMWHSCGRYSLEEHFTGCDPSLRKAFDLVVRTFRRNGPVTVYSQKTHIVMMVKVRFAGVVVRKRRIPLSLWLTRTVRHPLLQRTERFGPRSYGLQFRITGPGDLDRRLRRYKMEAYATGRREHLAHHQYGATPAIPDRIMRELNVSCRLHPDTKAR